MPDRQTLEPEYPQPLHCARRPKRKLCYVTSKNCPSKEWADEMSLADIDNMFDDLEPSSHSEDNEDHSVNEPEGSDEITSPFMQQQGLPTKELPGHRASPVKDCSSGLRPLSPELGFNCSFKAQGPVKTSSPIENVGNCIEEVHNRKVVVSPILFTCEDNETEEANMDNRCNDSNLESPPNRVVLKKSKMFYDRAEKSRPESPGNNTTGRRKPEAKTPVKKSASARLLPLVEASSRAKADVTTFLQKLRDAAQPKPSCSRKSLTPVKATSPTASDEDFLILEDDEPVWFSIPSKAATSKKHSRTSSRDRDSSADRGAKGSLPGTAPKQPPTDQADDKLEPQTASQRGKKKGRNKIKGSEEEQATVRGNKEELLSPEDGSLSDAKDPPKASQRKRPREVPSKDSEAAEQPQASGRGASGARGRPAAKQERRHQDSKNKKTLEDGCEIRKQKPSKVTQKVAQDTVREATTAQVCVGHADGEGKKMGSEEEGNPERQPAASEQSSPGDSPLVRKRKRRQPGEWWMSSSQRPEETDVPGSRPTAKKSKQSKKEAQTAVSSPLKAKKDGAAGRRTQKQPAPSPVQQAQRQALKKGNKAKRDKQSDNLSLKGSAPGRRKLFDEVEAEQLGQQEVMAQERHPLHSSPLFLPERENSLDSGSRVFQKMYQHESSKKKSSRPTAATPKKSEEQPGPEEPGKRRRRPPGNWWRVEGSSDDVESGSSQLQRLSVKRSQTERKKQPKQIKSPGLETPKSGNVSISPIPPEGAPAPPLRAEPASAPKTVKRSLATFKDIFTSTTESPSARARRKSVPNHKHVVTSSPAPEIPSGGEDVPAAVISMDAGDLKSLNNQRPPEDSKNQSDIMLESLQSGPPSMVRQQFTDMNLPSSRPEAVLSALDLAAPPLTPMVLQRQDKANLTQYFRSLWSVAADKGAEISPEDFSWYFYKGRAIGIQEDLACSSICCGKLLLGSFMKKPLWVDHSAKTVFNLFTSCVKVSINGRESRVAPSQTFMVQSGEAYSIQNVTMQPAVLHFTRISAESLD